MRIRNRIAAFVTALAALPAVAQIPVAGVALDEARVAEGRSDGSGDRPCRHDGGRRDAPRWSSMAA